MLAAGIDWQVVGAIAGVVGALIAIALAVPALVDARQAKRQAEAAETQAAAAKDQAEAAEKMAKLAEEEQTRATEPHLQIARYPGGAAQVQITESRPGQEVYGEKARVSVYVENLRPVVAELGEPYLNNRLGRLVSARCEQGQPAIVDFPIDAIEPDRSIQHKFRATVRVPEAGHTGVFTATLYLQGGEWNAADEAGD